MSKVMLVLIVLLVTISTGCVKRDPGNIPSSENIIIEEDVEQANVDDIDRSNSILNTDRDSVPIPSSEKIIIEESAELMSLDDLHRSNFLLNTDYKEKLAEVFSGKKYTLLESPLRTGKRDIYFAINSGEGGIFDTAVAFDVDSGVFRRALIIKEKLLLREDDSVLWDLSKYKNFFGFEIFFSYPVITEIPVGIVLTTYFDKGARVADDVTFQWNEAAYSFVKYDYRNP